MAVSVRVEQVPGLWLQIRAFGSDCNEVAAAVAHNAQSHVERGLCLVISADDTVLAATVASLTAVVGAACPVVGGTVVSLLESNAELAAAASLRVSVVLLEASWCRVGVGIARLGDGPIVGGQHAVGQAMQQLGLRNNDIASNHVAITLFDGSSSHEESFCLGTAMVVPGLRVVGGALGAPEYATGRRPSIWLGTERQDCLGVVLMIESKRKLASLGSIHVEPSNVRTIVTASNGKQIVELDGLPACSRYLALISDVANHTLLPDEPTLYPFGWYSRGRPYVRSVMRVHEDYLQMAGTVTRGQVLRVMKPTDIVAATHRDLASATAELGAMAGWLAFSCVEREYEARFRNVLPALRDEYFSVPCFGFESLGEQSGMMLINHTLTGLAIGDYL